MKTFFQLSLSFETANVIIVFSKMTFECVSTLPGVVDPKAAVVQLVGCFTTDTPMYSEPGNYSV